MKPMTAADYRANAEKIRAQRPSEIVTLSSGSVFDLYDLDLQGYVVTGRVPQSLLAEGLKAWKAQGKVPKGSAQELDDEDLTNSLIFMREVVHDVCKNPKFVEFATKDDEIGAADMLPADFQEIFNRAMGHQGVTGLEGLKSFRAGSKRGAARNRSNGKKQRNKGKQSTQLAGTVQ